MVGGDPEQRVARLAVQARRRDGAGKPEYVFAAIDALVQELIIREAALHDFLATFRGPLRAGIAWGVNADGRQEIFTIGTDGNVYSKWQDAINSGWSVWGGHGNPGVALQGIAP